MAMRQRAFASNHTTSSPARPVVTAN